MSYKNYQDYINILKHVADKVEVTGVNGSIASRNQSFDIWIDLLKKISKSDKNKLIFAGNGGSAGICSHCSTDYTKNGGIRAIALNDSSMLTCLSNDYSYEEVFSKQIGYYGFKDDVLIAISSSGMSQNILNVVNHANQMGIYTITLSGFKSDNNLRKIGKLNFYVDSNEYGFVEILHLVLIHTALDLFLKN